MSSKTLFTSCTSRAKRGFTLIELLVVIAIIAILASILFPVFGRARENARRSACSSNLRQIGLGIFQYSQDYDERLPGATDGGGGANQGGGWVYYTQFNGTPSAANRVFFPERGSIYPYIKSAQIYICPSDSIGQGDGDSYAINACVDTKDSTGTANNPYNFKPGLALAAFDDAAQTFLLSEEGTGNSSSDSTDDGYISVGAGNKLANRHFDGTNLLFLDGHVKYYQNSRAYAGNFHAGGRVVVPSGTTPTAGQAVNRGDGCP